MASNVDAQDVLARVMRDRGYANPQDLAAASGMPYNTLYRWATGKSNPHRRSLVALLDTLGLDAESYGVLRPEPVKTAPSAASALDEQMRHDVAIIAARIEAMERNIIALCVKFGVETTAPEGIHA